MKLNSLLYQKLIDLCILSKKTIINQKLKLIKLDKINYKIIRNNNIKKENKKDLIMEDLMKNLNKNQQKKMNLIRLIDIKKFAKLIINTIKNR